MRADIYRLLRHQTIFQLEWMSVKGRITIGATRKADKKINPYTLNKPHLI